VKICRNISENILPQCKKANSLYICYQLGKKEQQTFNINKFEANTNKRPYNVKHISNNNWKGQCFLIKRYAIT
jgi:hypothetical protein